MDLCTLPDILISNNFIVIIYLLIMEDILVLNKSEIAFSERKMTDQYVSRQASRRNTPDNASMSLMTEGGEAFFNYISRINANIEKNVLVLSSKHHYYYDKDELKGVSAVINMKRLNLMSHLENYLHGICDILSQNAKFIGCFADRGTTKATGVPSRIYNRFLSFLDGRTDIEIDRRYLLRLFESCGFRIIDMTEINGLTYFTSIKNGG
jgi:hypothetical protein